MRLKKALLAATACGAVLAPTFALAQASSETSQSQASQSQEIIVTARKRQ